MRLLEIHETEMSNLRAWGDSQRADLHKHMLEQSEYTAGAPRPPSGRSTGAPVALPGSRHLRRAGRLLRRLARMARTLARRALALARRTAGRGKRWALRAARSLKAPARRAAGKVKRLILQAIRSGGTADRGPQA